MGNFKKLKDLIVEEEGYELKVDHINNLMKSYIEEENGSKESKIAVIWHPTQEFNVEPPIYLVPGNEVDNENPRIIGMSIYFDRPLDAGGMTMMLEMPNDAMIKGLTAMRKELKRKQKLVQQKILNEKSPTSQ